MITIANPTGDNSDWIAYGRLLREMNRYTIRPARLDKPLLSTEFDVYIWRAGLNQFRRIGVRSTYRSADLLIRQHIRKRYRRRSKVWHQPPLYIRCVECGLLRRRSTAHDTMCYDCYFDIWRDDQLPDDYPAFDADQLFH